MRAVALIVLMPLAAEAGPAIGYAQATGYFKKDSRPTLYQPLNLLDSREATAWCTPTSDPLADHLTFGFKGPVTIDEIRIYTGNGFDEATFKEFNRAKKLAIKGPSGAHTVTIADQRGLQSVALNPPLTGSQFTVEVLDQYEADDPDTPVCVTDIVFYADGKALNGPWLTQKLKYDKQRATILGTWFSGSEGAPERYLSFYFDGTYRFVYDPYDPEAKDKVITGGYDLSGNRVTLEVPGKGRVSARMHRDKKNDPETSSVIRTLTLEGDLPEDLKRPYRDRM